jgi:ABC-type dipeptide/oligopeptide/nickel transport system ATPase component
VTAAKASVLTLRDLRVQFDTPNGPVQAVRGVDLDLAPGEILGVVGESGSGKSVTFLAMLGLLPKSAQISGSAKIEDTELVGADTKSMRSIRGQRVSMIFQDPLSALNPVPSTCSVPSASLSPSSAPSSIRTNSREACANA